MRLESLYFADILAAAHTLARFTAGVDYQAFIADELLRSAVLHQLMIIGEATASISAEVRKRYPSIAWTDIKAFRNVVVHQYFGLDWEIVWEAATADALTLRKQVAGIIQTEFPNMKLHPTVCLLSC